MRRFAISALLAISLPCALCLAAPRITVDNPLYAADVQSGSTASHVFTVSNTGDETLMISMVQTSCGCTTATLAKPDLAPGESIGLEAKVNTVGFTGKVEKTVEVQSNDPANPSLTLRLDLTLLDPERPQTPSSSSAAPSPAPSSAPRPGLAASSSPGGPSAAQSLGWPVIFGVALAVDVALVLLLFILVSSGT